MRSALVCVVLGMLATTARADPFEVRNPVPNAPPGPSAAVDPFESTPAVEILDPGAKQRRIATWMAVGGGVLWGGAVVVSRVMLHRYNDALAHLEAGDDPYKATDDANHAQRVAKIWGTTLFAAGAIAIGASIVIYSDAPGKIRRERVIVAPAINHDGAGVAISGGF